MTDSTSVNWTPVVSYDSTGNKDNTYCSLLIKIDNNQYIATAGAKFGYGVPIQPVKRFYSSLGDTPPCSRIFLVGSDIGIDTFSIYRSEQKETPPEYEQLAAVLKFYNKLTPDENRIKLGSKFISASGKQAFGIVKWGMSHEALIVSSELTKPINDDDEIMESIVHPPLVAHSHLYCGNPANFGTMWRRLTSNSLYYNIVWPRFGQVNSDSTELKNIMGTAWACEAFGYGRADGLGLKSQISIFSSYGMNLEFSDIFQGAGINPPPPYAVVNYKEPLAINNTEYLLNAKALTIEQHDIGAVAVELDVLQDRSIEKSVAETIRDGLLAKYGPPARVYRAFQPDFYDGCHFLNGFMCEWDVEAKTVAMVGSTFSTWPESLSQSDFRGGAIEVHNMWTENGGGKWEMCNNKKIAEIVSKNLLPDRIYYIRPETRSSLNPITQEQARQNKDADATKQKNGVRSIQNQL